MIYNNYDLKRNFMGCFSLFVYNTRLTNPFVNNYYDNKVIAQQNQVEF